MSRVPVRPALLRWACARSGRSAEELKEKDAFKKLDAWLNDDEESHPTFRQLEAFAKATYTPIGYFFLQEPPLENLPITDFRTIADTEISQPSPNLLDTLYLCQRRQDWFRDEARATGEPQFEFVGSLTTYDDAFTTADAIRDALKIDIEQRRKARDSDTALRLFVEQAETSGILVMVSGVVGNNTSRSLDTNEFRGFALSDPVAPLIFINGVDSKAAQNFTLAHELAHIWLGQSGVSNSRSVGARDHATERWCSQVAAEMLVPSRLVREEFDPNKDIHGEINRLAERFKVSSLVVLRSIFDAGMLDEQEYWPAYHKELASIPEQKISKGGDYYRNVPVRAGKRFTRALAVSTLEGRTSFTEALQLLDVKQEAVVKRIAKDLGVQF